MIFLSNNILLLQDKKITEEKGNNYYIKCIKNKTAWGKIMFLVEIKLMYAGSRIVKSRLFKSCGVIGVI